MAYCAQHPNKPAYKTCNYCHQPVCQDCIVKYSPHTKCKNCYANERRDFANGKVRRMQYAIVTTVIAFLISSAVFYLFARDGNRLNVFDCIIIGLFISSFVSIATLFQDKVRKRVLAPILAAVYMTIIYILSYQNIESPVFEYVVMLLGLQCMIINIKKLHRLKIKAAIINQQMDEFVEDFNRHTYQQMHFDGEKYID